MHENGKGSVPNFADKQIELEKLGTGGSRGNTSQLCLTPCP